MNAAWTWTIQVVEECSGHAQAMSVLDGLRAQDGFLAGRIIGDGRYKPYAAQAFFVDTDTTHDPGEWFPDGMRRVFTPPWLLAPHYHGPRCACASCVPA